MFELVQDDGLDGHPAQDQSIKADQGSAQRVMEESSVYDAGLADEAAEPAGQDRPFLTLLVLLVLVVAVALAYSYRHDLERGIERVLGNGGVASDNAAVGTEAGARITAVNPLRSPPQDESNGAAGLLPIDQQIQSEKLPAATEPEPLALPSVFIIQFDRGSANLDARAEQTLDQALQSIEAMRERSAYVTGFADSEEFRGDQESLSLRRAIGVARYFMLRGVPRSRLQVAAFSVADSPLETTLTRLQSGAWGTVEVRIESPRYSG